MRAVPRVRLCIRIGRGRRALLGALVIVLALLSAWLLLGRFLESVGSSPARKGRQHNAPCHSVVCAIPTRKHRRNPHTHRRPGKAKLSVDHDHGAVSRNSSALARMEGDHALLAALDTHAQLQRSIRTGRLPLSAVVYECTEGIQCGGLTDRFEGILVSYVWAVATRRALLIRYCKPGPLQRFYGPHRVDWTLGELDSAQQSAILGAQRVHVRRHQDDTGDCDVLVARLLSLSQPVFRLTTNHAKSCVRRLLSQHLGIATFTDAHLMALLFHYLFKPSSLLQQAVRLFARRHDWRAESSACLHVRRGGFPVNQAASERLRYKDLDGFWRCAEQVSRLSASRRFAISSWVVISDSNDVIEQAKLTLGKLGRVLGTTAVGPVLHVDKQYDDKNYSNGDVALGHPEAATPQQLGRCPSIRRFNGEVRVFLDHFILSACRILIGSRKSGFSASAAALHAGSKSLLFMVPEPSSTHRAGFPRVPSNVSCTEYHPGKMW